MNTFYVKYTYNRILFSPNREENSDISYDMDESGWHYAKDTHTKIQMLYDSTSVRYLEQSNSEAERTVVASSWEESGTGSYRV